ncbi:MAG: PilZ domain-containing protein [Treponema sp.]|jgi:hypothetical protein|nr:PilZ domain-containing protein [Treponema sp.]
MGEKRKHVRYTASALVRTEDGQLYTLKDISTGGCCLRCPLDRSVNLKLAQDYRVTLKPEPAARADSFDMTIEPCWIQSGSGFYEIGCFISGFPEGKRYQSFANYLAWRAAQE